MGETNFNIQSFNDREKLHNQYDVKISGITIWKTSKYICGIRATYRIIHSIDDSRIITIEGNDMVIES